MSTDTSVNQPTSRVASKKLDLTFPKLKLARAQDQIVNLNVCIQKFIDNSGPTVTSQGTPQVDSSGKRIYTGTVEFSPPLEDELSIDIGEIVHNLRSCLNQVITAGIRGNNDPSGEINHSDFPICKRSSSFDSFAARKTDGAPAGMIPIIKEFEPWSDSDDSRLWNLHSLNNQDKHDAIVLCTASTIVTADWLQPANSEQARLADLEPSDRPIKFLLNPDTESPISVTFDNLTRVHAGENVTDSLVSIAERVSEVVERFSQFRY